MDAFEALRAHLGRLDARRRQADLLRWLPRALLIALLAALAVALLARARPLLTAGEVARLGAALAVAAVALAAVVTLARRRSLHEQAQFADQRFALRERATAAVELRAGRLTAPDEVAARQLRDALAAAEGVDLAQQMPLASRPAEWLPALGAAVALAILLWLPNPQETALRQQRALGAAVAEQAATVAALAEQIAADETLSPEQQAALQQPLEEALATLREPGIDQAEAVAALSAAETELRRLATEFEAAGTTAAAADAAAALAANADAAELGEALQDAQPAGAAAAAGALAGSLPQLSDAARQSLAEALAQAATEIGAADPALAGALADAADALAAGDTAAAADALRQAETTLARQATADAAAAQAGDAAGQLGVARQEVAQVGAPTDATQPGAGEADQTGGAGQQGANAGEGEGNGAGTEGSDGEGVAGQGTATGGPAPGGGHVENVFVPAPVELGGAGQDVELETQCLGAACGPAAETPSQSGPSGGSSVPFDQVFGQYRDAAFEALSGSDVPLGLQTLVRDYFTALEP